MSDEQRKDEETEVEAHRGGLGMNDEPQDEGDVEAHRGGLGRGTNAAHDEVDNDDDDVEAHRSGLGRPTLG